MKVGALPPPLLLDAADVIEVISHGLDYLFLGRHYGFHGTKWLGIAAVAPVVWVPNYVVTRQLLPMDVPLWGSALRALPAGLVLLAVAGALPRGVWWWRSAVLGTLNVGAFFLLVYVAAQLLPRASPPR